MKPIFEPWLEDLISEAENEQNMINEIKVPTTIYLAALAALRDQHTTANETEEADLIQSVITCCAELEKHNDELRVMLDRDVEDYIASFTRATIRATQKAIENAQHNYIKLTKDV